MEDFRLEHLREELSYINETYGLRFSIYVVNTDGGTATIRLCTGDFMSPQDRVLGRTAAEAEAWMRAFRFGLSLRNRR